MKLMPQAMNSSKWLLWNCYHIYNTKADHIGGLESVSPKVADLYCINFSWPTLFIFQLPKTDTSIDTCQKSNFAKIQASDPNFALFDATLSGEQSSISVCDIR